MYVYVCVYSTCVYIHVLNVVLFFEREHWLAPNVSLINWISHRPIPVYYLNHSPKETAWDVWKCAVGPFVTDLLLFHSSILFLNLFQYSSIFFMHIFHPFSCFDPNEDFWNVVGFVYFGLKTNGGLL